MIYDSRRIDGQIGGQKQDSRKELGAKAMLMLFSLTSWPRQKRNNESGKFCADDRANPRPIDNQFAFNTEFRAKNQFLTQL
jgi:hypothetical protein